VPHGFFQEAELCEPTATEREDVFGHQVAFAQYEKDGVNPVCHHTAEEERK